MKKEAYDMEKTDDDDLKFEFVGFKILHWKKNSVEQKKACSLKF